MAKKSIFSALFGSGKKNDEKKKKKKQKQTVVVQAAKSGMLGKQVQQQTKQNPNWNQKGNQYSNGGGKKNRNKQPVQSKNKGTTVKQTVSASKAKQNREKLKNDFNRTMGEGFKQSRQEQARHAGNLRFADGVRNRNESLTPQNSSTWRNAKVNRYSSGLQRRNEQNASTPFNGTRTNNAIQNNRGINPAMTLANSLHGNNIQAQEANQRALHRNPNTVNIATSYMLGKNPQISDANKNLQEWKRSHSNAFDTTGTTLKDQKAIQKEQQKWQKANRQNDLDAMESAHENAEKIRGKYGVQTDESGSNPYLSKNFNSKANRNVGIMSTISKLGNEPATNSKYKNKADEMARSAYGAEDDLNVLYRASNQQQKTYNYIYNTSGEKAAREYVRGVLKPQQSTKDYQSGTGYFGNTKKQSADKQAAQEAQEHPVLSSIGSVATNTVMPAVAAVQNANDVARGRRVNQHSVANQLSQNAQKQRQQISERIGKRYGNGMSMLYDAGMATADSLAAQMFGRAGTAVMATNAANNAFMNKLEDGADQNEAAAFGLINGAVEYATEKLPFERINKALKGAGRSLAGRSARVYTKDLRSFVREIGSQAGIEGSEELISEIADNAADDFIFGENSERNKQKRQYMAQGMSESEANKQSMLEYYVANPMESFAVGALSGGMAIAPISGLNRLSTGKYIRSNSAILDDYVNKGMQVDNEKGRQLAQQINTQRNNGQNPSKISVANLVGYVQQDAYDKLSVDSKRKQEIHDYAQSGIVVPEEPAQQNKLVAAFNRYDGKGLREFSKKDFVNAWSLKSNEIARDLNEYNATKNNPDLSMRNQELENNIREYKDYAEDLVNSKALIDRQDMYTRDMISQINSVLKPDSVTDQAETTTDEEYNNPADNVAAQSIGKTQVNSDVPNGQQTASEDAETADQTGNEQTTDGTEATAENTSQGDTAQADENASQSNTPDMSDRTKQFTEVANSGQSVSAFATTPDNNAMWLDQGQAGKGGYGTARISERAQKAGEDPATFAANLAEAVSNPNHKESPANVYATNDPNNERQFAYNGYTAIVFYVDMNDGNGARWTLMDGWKNGDTTSQADTESQSASAPVSTQTAGATAFNPNETQDASTGQQSTTQTGTNAASTNTTNGNTTPTNTAQTNTTSENVASNNTPSENVASPISDVASPQTTGTTESASQPNTARTEEFTRTAKMAPEETTTYAPNDEEPIIVRYAVVPMSSLLASNTDRGDINPDYPAEFQPRDRTRGATQNQINTMLVNLNPAKLMDSPMNAAEGAPIVRNDGVVISGNMRTMTLQRMYATNAEKAREYAEAVERRANALGIDTTDMPEEPVLVGISQNNDATYLRNLALRLNGQSTAAYSATEQATTDAQAMTDNMLSLLTISDRGLNVNDNADFIDEFIERIVPATERNDMYDEHGNLSKAGKERIENAVFAYAYNDTGLLHRLSESLDDGAKNVTNALLDVSGKAAAFKQGVQAGNYPDIPLTESIIEAVNLYNDSKSQGYPSVDDYLAQVQVDENGETIQHSNEATMLSRFIDANRRGAKQLREYLNLLYDVAMEDAQVAGQTDMFAMADDQGIDAGKSNLDNTIEDVYEGADARYDEIKAEEGRERKGPRYTRADRTEPGTDQRSDSSSEQTTGERTDESNSRSTGESNTADDRGNKAEEKPVSVKAAAKSLGYGEMKGSTLTVHKDISKDTSENAKVVNDAIQTAKKAAKLRANQYDIVSIQTQDSVVKFIKVKRFNADDFPAVTKITTVDAEGNVTTETPEDQIITNKATYVPDDYSGFDVESAKKLNEKWRKAYQTTGNKSYKYSSVKIKNGKYFHDKFDDYLYGEAEESESTKAEEKPKQTKTEAKPTKKAVAKESTSTKGNTETEQAKESDSKSASEKENIANVAEKKAANATKKKTASSREKAQSRAKNAKFAKIEREFKLTGTEQGIDYNEISELTLQADDGKTAIVAEMNDGSTVKLGRMYDEDAVDALFELRQAIQNNAKPAKNRTNGELRSLTGNAHKTERNTEQRNMGAHDNVVYIANEHTNESSIKGKKYSEAINYPMNKTAAHIWEKNGGLRGIRETIRQLFNLNVGRAGYKYRGKKAEKIAGYYIPGGSNLFLRSMGRNATALHELGHYIDKRIHLSDSDVMREFVEKNASIANELINLGYDESEVSDEIAADFIKAYIADPQFAYDSYTAHNEKAEGYDNHSLYNYVERTLKQHKLDDKVKSLRSAVLKFDSKDKLDRVISSITTHADVETGQSKAVFGKIYQAFISKNYGFERMDKELRKRGVVVKTSDASILKDIADNASSLTESNIERNVTDVHGKIIFDELPFAEIYKQLFDKSVIDKIQLKPQYEAEANASLRQKIRSAEESAKRKTNLKPVVKKLKIKQIREEFDAYLKLRHSLDWFAQNKTTFAEDVISSSEEAEQLINELDEKYTVNINGEPTSLFRKVSDEIYKWNDTFMRRWLVDTGYLDKEAYERMHEMYPHYVPNKRVMEENPSDISRGNSTVSRGIKLMGASREGSDRDTYSGIESYIYNVDTIIRGVTQNEVKRELYSMMHSSDADVRELMTYYFTEEPDTSLVKFTSFDMTEIKKKLITGLVTEQLNDLKQNDPEEYARFNNMSDVEQLMYLSHMQGLDIIDEVIANTIWKAAKTDNVMDDTHMIMYDRDGKPHQVKVNDPYMLDALLRGKPNTGTKILGAIGKYLTRPFSALTTSLSVVFVPMNAARDFQHGFMYTPSVKYNTKFDNVLPIRQFAEYIKDYAVALKDILKDQNSVIGKSKYYTSEDFRQMQTYNGFVAKYIPGAADPAKDLVRDITGTRLTIAKLFDLIEKLNAVVEGTPRLVAYRRGIQATGDRTVAMEWSREATVNFWRKGAASSTLNNVVPFLNAGLAGIDQFRRMAANDTIDDRKNVIMRALVSQALIATIVGAIAGFGDDKDKNMDELEQFSDYVKLNYYLIPLPGGDYWIRIPKDREMSAIFGTSLQYVVGMSVCPEIKPSDDLVEYVKTVLTSFVPPHELIGAPIFQAMNNKTWYGSPIVGQAEENLLYTGNYDQIYDANTSRLAILISEVLCKGLNIPMSKDSPSGASITPKGIDYILDSLGGGFADIILPFTRPGSEGVVQSLADKFLANPYKQNRYASEVYDIKEMLTSNNTADSASEKEQLWYTVFNTATTKSSEGERDSDEYNWKDSIVTIADYRKQIKDLEEDKTLSRSERSKKIYEINKRIAAISEEIVKDYRSGAKPKAFYGDVKEPQDFKRKGITKRDYEKFLEMYVKLETKKTADDTNGASKDEIYFSTVALGLGKSSTKSILDRIKTSKEESGAELYDKYKPCVEYLKTYDAYEKAVSVPDGASTADRYLKILSNNSLNDDAKTVLINAINTSGETASDIRNRYQPLVDAGITVKEYMSVENDMDKYSGSNNSVKYYSIMNNGNLSEEKKRLMVDSMAKTKRSTYEKLKRVVDSGISMEVYQDFVDNELARYGRYSNAELYNAVGVVNERYNLNHEQRSALYNAKKLGR